MATEKTCTVQLKDTHLALAIPNDINKSNASRRCLRVLAWMIAGSTWEQMEEHPWTVAILGTKTVKFIELIGKGVLKQLQPTFFPPQGNPSHLIAWCSVFKKVFFGLRSGQTISRSSWIHWVQGLHHVSRPPDSSIRATKKSEVGSTSDLTCACGMSIQIKKTKAPKNEKRWKEKNNESYKDIGQWLEQDLAEEK